MTIAMFILGTFVDFFAEVLAMSLLRVAAFEQPALESRSDPVTERWDVPAMR